uniref:Uncharacterized protein n=1 Tax=Megaselia scalaris TaxID=36166 RepID=T1GTE5_MEGSC
MEMNTRISTRKRHGQRDQNIDLERHNPRNHRIHTRSKKDLASCHLTKHQAGVGFIIRGKARYCVSRWTPIKNTTLCPGYENGKNTLILTRKPHGQRVKKIDLEQDLKRILQDYDLDIMAIQDIRKWKGPGKIEDSGSYLLSL